MGVWGHPHIGKRSAEPGVALHPGHASSYVGPTTFGLPHGYPHVLGKRSAEPTELESPSTLAMLPAMSVPPPMVCLICSTGRGALMLMLMLMPMDSTMACPTTGQLTPSSTCTARGALTPRLSQLL